jgi:hypothetical protein
MPHPSFTSLAATLTRSEDWATIRRAWDDSEGLHQALLRRVPPAMAAQVMQIRRDDPARGIRGSQVVVVMRSTAAAAKMRLLLADWFDELQAAGWGIASVQVIARRHQGIDTAPVDPPARLPVPEAARAQMRAIAAELPDGPLRKALQRLGSRSPAGRQIQDH